jgi:hypothetical protein
LIVFEKWTLTNNLTDPDGHKLGYNTNENVKMPVCRTKTHGKLDGKDYKSYSPLFSKRQKDTILYA